jgi:hypothetical protein
MPRSNRPRGRRAAEGDDDFDISRALLGRLAVETKRDGQWNVQPLASTSAIKSYVCPGCGLEVAPGVAHTVAWRADGIMGAADDLAGRRHWHLHCWRIRP